MSKKKNTLKDLDEFLKQQAASLVTPESLPEPMKNSHLPKEEKPLPSTEFPLTFNKIIQDLTTMAEKEGAQFRKKFYDLIIQTLEAQPQSLPEDKMLINTALYLKSGADWKEAIRKYWRKK